MPGAGDPLGRRRVFIAGLSVFAAAYLWVGLAPNGQWLILARALQGVGATVVAPSSLSLLTASFPQGRERTRTVAWYGATAGIGASLGLVAGDALAHWISWRAGFFINVPIGAAMMVLAPRHLVETTRSPGHFDIAGAITATLGMGAMIGFFYFTTQFLQLVLGFNPLEAGLAFFPMTVVDFAVAMAMAIPRLTARFGNAALLASGVAVTLAGMVWLGRLDASSTYLAARSPRPWSCWAPDRA